MEMELDLGLSESHTSPPSMCVVSPAWDFLSSRETKKQGGREEKLFGANKVTSNECGDNTDLEQSFHLPKSVFPHYKMGVIVPTVQGCSQD